MPASWSKYLGYFQDLEPFTPVTDVLAGTPVLLSSGNWGIPDIDVLANTKASFRVRGLFRGKKRNASDAIALNAELSFTAGQGIEVSLGGKMKAYAASPSGSAFVDFTLDPGSVSGGGGGGGSPSSTGLQPDDVLVTGTGVTATDNAAVAAAVSSLNTAGKGRLVATGGVAINARHVFTAPIGLAFLNGGYYIEDGGSSGTPDVGFQWSTYNHPVNMTSTAISSAVAAGSDRFVTTLALAPDDVVAVWSDDALTGVTPHATGYTYRPGEILKISDAVLGVANTYRFDDFTDDAMTTNPKVVKLPMLRGVVVDGLKVVHKAGTNFNTDFLLFQFCDNVEVRNSTFGYAGAGKVYFKFCYNWRVKNCTFEDISDRNTNATIGYGIADVWSTLGSVDGCSFRSYRHAITTGGQEVAGAGTTYSYGSAKSVTIFNNKFQGNGTQGTSSPFTHAGRSYLDTHTEGRRWSITGNQFHVPSGDETNIGITIRARDVWVTGNTFFSHNSAKPIAVYASGAVIANNVFKGGWYCSVEDGGFNPDVNDTVWTNNTFKNFGGPPIAISAGTGHVISGNVFMNVASSGSGGKPRACVAITSLSAGGTVRVANNDMPKQTNLYSVHTGSQALAAVEIVGNTCPGYGGCSFGLDRTLSSTIDFERKYAKYNGVPETLIVNFPSHGLTSAQYGFPIDVAGIVWDDTSAVAIAGVLLETYDANNVCLAAPGAVVTLLTSRIAQTYNPGTDGRRLWFDKSASGWKSAKPSDSTASHLLVVAVVNGSEFTAESVSNITAASTSADRLLGIHDMGNVTGAVTIDLAAGTSRNKRMVATGDVTFTIATGSPIGDFKILINPNNHTITWPGNVVFEGSTPPTLTGTIERGVALFYAGT